MASSNVRFFFGTLAKYQALESKDPLALYFLTDEETGKVYLYKGSQLYASDALASAIADGWMSKEDKINLDNLVTNAITGLTPVDGSIVVTDGNKIGVALSAEAGNILSLKSDGLYVDASGSIDVPEYSIEKQAVADEGFNVTYKLKKTVGSESSYVGDAINVAIDAVLSSAEFKTATEADVPYDGAAIGDPYIELGFNDDARTHLYVPMKGLVDTYVAGDGIKIVDNTISVNLGSTTNGLHFVDGTLNLAIATKDSAGAMSAIDKAELDKIADGDVAKWNAAQANAEATAATALSSAKTELEGKITAAQTAAEGKVTELANGAVKTNTDNITALQNGKADKATTLAGYGITDAYTKTETYTKDEVQELLTWGEF